MPARRALAAVLLVLSASCAEAPAPPARGAQPLDLSAVAVYGRHAAVRGKVDVRIANDGDAALEVLSFQLRTPLYEMVPPADRPSTLPPDGKARVVPVPFGAVRCEVTDPAGADVLLEVRSADGVVDVPVPLEDGEPGLVRAHRLACGSAAAADVAVLSLGPEWVRDDAAQPPLLRTSLRAERRGSGSLEVTQLSRNILFGVDVPEPSPLLVLDPQEPSDAVEVVLAATRCDPHALTESKTSFTFPVFLRLAGGDEVASAVTVTGAGREALQALLDDTCVGD